MDAPATWSSEYGRDSRATYAQRVESLGREAVQGYHLDANSLAREDALSHLQRPVNLDPVRVGAFQGKISSERGHWCSGTGGFCKNAFCARTLKCAHLPVRLGRGGKQDSQEFSLVIT